MRSFDEKKGNKKLLSTRNGIMEKLGIMV